MSKTQVDLDIHAVKSEILQADWMQAYIDGVARQQAGADEHVKSFMGYDRAKAIIYPNTKEYNG